MNRQSDASRFHVRTRAYYGEGGLCRLQSSRVAVVGVGGLGTEVCKNLSMLGVAEMLICDPDTVSAGNLNRGVFFRPDDIDQVAKVDAVRRGISELALGTRVSAFAIPVQDAPEEFWDVDLVCCCVDNDHARFVVNLCLLGGGVARPCLNAAVGRDLVAVSCLVPGRTACLVCGWEKAHYEAMLREEVATQCDAFFASTVSAFPQISPLVSLAGAWLSYMAAAVLSGSGSDHEGASWRVDLRRGQAFKATVCRNAECVEPLCVEGTQNG